MGKECLQLFMNLKLSVEHRNDVNKCIDALEMYFKPKRTVVYERFQLNACIQNVGENVEAFENRLWKLASSCNNGVFIDQLIRNLLFIGLLDKLIQERLLKESTLTLDKAVDIARASSMAMNQVESMKIDQKSKNDQTVHVIIKQRNKRAYSRKNPRQKSFKHEDQPSWSFRFSSPKINHSCQLKHVKQWDYSNRQLCTKSIIFEEYKDVFWGLGLIGNTKLQLNSMVQPVQQSPRRVLVALQKKVTVRINEMESRGLIIKEQEPTEWICSMMVTLKLGKCNQYWTLQKCF